MNATTITSDFAYAEKPFPQEKITLTNGLTLNCAILGDNNAPPLIFLHGFPESHRSWRYQMAHFADKFRVIAPDQRGYGLSSRPENQADYDIQHLVGDILQLADALGYDKFTLAAHDWGGAVGWAVALAAQERVEKLIIANAPHPLQFQKAIISDPDQRAASQYITAFRNPEFEKSVARTGFDHFLQNNFLNHVAADKVSQYERGHYLDYWSADGALTAMLNWYRASAIVVPAMDDDVPMPDFAANPFPVLKMPVQVIWAMDDSALRPSLLDGLEDLCSDYRLSKIEKCGHFVQWEQPDAVIAAMEDFLG